MKLKLKMTISGHRGRSDFLSSFLFCCTLGCNNINSSRRTIDSQPNMDGKNWRKAWMNESKAESEQTEKKWICCKCKTMIIAWRPSWRLLWVVSVESWSGWLCPGLPWNSTFWKYMPHQALLLTHITREYKNR